MEKPTVVLVTGAARGIGRSLSASLLARGYAVAMLDRSGMEPLDEAMAIRADVTDAAQVRAAVEQVVGRFGRIDILVNNACRVTSRPLHDRAIDEIAGELDVNLLGYIRMVQAVLPVMRAQGAGLIHNVSSAVAASGFPGLSVYAAAKAAVEALSRSLRMELAPAGIAVTIMHPPLTETESSLPISRQGIPLQFFAKPEAVGAKLANKIESRSPVICADFATWQFQVLTRYFPNLAGRMFSKLKPQAETDLGSGSSLS